MKSFYDELLSDEGDIFRECPVVWPALRAVIITGLFESVQGPKKYIIVEVPSEILEEVVKITVSTPRMGVKIEWMDKTLDKIATKESI